MSDDQEQNVALDPAFFDGRLMIDILTWDWNLRVSINSAAMRPRARFQGLDYGRDFTINGRIRAPRELRGKTIKVTLSPFGPKVRFGRGGLQQVGRLSVLPPGGGSDFVAGIMLPDGAIATTASSLAAIWKHLDIWTVQRDARGAEITAYAFSADIHQNLWTWANAE